MNTLFSLFIVITMLSSGTAHAATLACQVASNQVTVLTDRSDVPVNLSRYEILQILGETVSISGNTYIVPNVQGIAAFVERRAKLGLSDSSIAQSARQALTAELKMVVDALKSQADSLQIDAIRKMVSDDIQLHIATLNRSDYSQYDTRVFVLPDGREVKNYGIKAKWFMENYLSVFNLLTGI